MTDTYHEHLELLHEWNEGTIFVPTATTIHSTDLGVMVVQDIDQAPIMYDAPTGAVIGSGSVTKVQVCAVYGDEDELHKLVVFGNDRGSTAVLIDSTSGTPRDGGEKKENEGWENS